MGDGYYAELVHQGIYVLDYGAGNVCSLFNALNSTGYSFNVVTCPEDLEKATCLIFPGVGSFGAAVQALHDRGLFTALQRYLESGRPFLGVCIGMQVLFEESDESPGVRGLGFFPGAVKRFGSLQKIELPVPHMGWNDAPLAGDPRKEKYGTHPLQTDGKVYFVHSYMVPLPGDCTTKGVPDYVLSVTEYGGQKFVSSVQRGNICATQFHPEKSGAIGVNVIKRFLDYSVMQCNGDVTMPVLTKRFVPAS